MVMAHFHGVLTLGYAETGQGLLKAKINLLAKKVHVPAA